MPFRLRQATAVTWLVTQQSQDQGSLAQFPPAQALIGLLVHPETNLLVHVQAVLLGPRLHERPVKEVTIVGDVHCGLGLQAARQQILSRNLVCLYDNDMFRVPKCAPRSALVNAWKTMKQLLHRGSLG